MLRTELYGSLTLLAENSLFAVKLVLTVTTVKACRKVARLSFHPR
jgi:hypothetical protein